MNATPTVQRLPAVTLELQVLAVLKGNTTPIPVKAIDCGLPAALSVTASAAVRGPTCDGVNVMQSVHMVFPGAGPHRGVSLGRVGCAPNSTRFRPGTSYPTMH
jgi:hypothetical protein